MTIYTKHLQYSSNERMWTLAVFVHPVGSGFRSESRSLEDVCLYRAGLGQQIDGLTVVTLEEVPFQKHPNLRIY